MYIQHIENGHLMKGKKHTEVAKKLISDKLKNKSHSKERIKKRRQSRMESQEIQNQVIIDYKSGMTIKAIKEKYGFGGNGKIYRILDANNVERLNNFTKWTGKTHSIETKIKMSKARKKYFKNHNK